MHVVKTVSPQIKIVPRAVFPSYDLVITNQGTNEEFTETALASEDGNLVSIDLGLTPIEGSTYSIEIFNSGNIQYRGEIFCTDQTDLQNYEITLGEYDESTEETTYKTLT